MRKKISWAVMGLGLQGQKLVRAIERSRHAALTNTASERERGSFAQVLKDKNVDAVAIATPNDRHAAQVIAAAKAGKHILCEKPLALTLKEGRAISKAVRASRVRLFVNYHLRMHPEAQKVRALLAQKKLGDLTYIEMQWSVGGLAGKKLPPLPRHMRWREDPKKSGGGALMARGVHLFDLLRFLTGEEVAEVRGWSDATKRRVDRTMVAVCALQSGVPAVITTSKAIPHTDNRVVLYGTKKTLTLRALFAEDPQLLYRKVFDACAEELAGKKTPLATLNDGLAVIKIVEDFTRAVLTKTA